MGVDGMTALERVKALAYTLKQERIAHKDAKEARDAAEAEYEEVVQRQKARLNEVREREQEVQKRVSKAGGEFYEAMAALFDINP